MMQSSSPTRGPGRIAVETIPDRFLELLAVRDFDGMATLMAPDLRARLLLPHGCEEHMGRGAVIGTIESWFGPSSEFRLISSTTDTVGARHRLGWRVRVVRGAAAEEIEQLAFLDLGADGIERLDLLCSGFQAEPQWDEAAGHHFDAGVMGCADGLAQEFRRRLLEVPVGASISVVVRDPAAKEDLPALARMLGQSVTSVEAYDDGRLEITVERNQ